MKIFISSEAPRGVLDALRGLGYELLLLPPCPRLAPPVASHADMLLFRRADGALVCERLYYEENRGLFERSGCRIVTSEQILVPRYPADVAFNALALRGKLFCHRRAAPELAADGTALRYVRQGYARCSCCVTADGCAVTADPSLAAAAERERIPQLIISSGNITLPGYDYGFIGGASGLLADGRTALFGELAAHPDGERIAAFLRVHGGYTELMRGKLYDVGGFVPAE